MTGPDDLVLVVVPDCETHRGGCPPRYSSSTLVMAFDRDTVETLAELYRRDVA